MRLEMIGINHHRSSVEVREKTALSSQKLIDAVNTLVEEERIEGATILSTCNRTEVYLSPLIHSALEQLQRLFQKVTDIPEEYLDQTFQYRDEDAVRHLFRVASGLDSQILGEKQILAQVKDAYGLAIEQKTASSVINRLFMKAIETGKEVHTRTEISTGAVSVASAAIHIADRIFGNLGKCKVLLVGAGETARLAARLLISAGVREWRISNRTEANAKALADILGGEVTHFPPAPADLEWADLVVTATSSTVPVITEPVVKEGRARADGLQLILDLAVPRDVEPAVGQLPNSYLYTVDDFLDLVTSNLESRRKEAVKAEKLIDKSVAEFSTWYSEYRVAPTIQQIQNVLEALRLQEIARNQSKLQGVDPDQLDRFSRSLMKKVSSLIVVNLKKASLEESNLDMAKAVTRALATEQDQHVNSIIERLDYELSH